MQTRKRRRGETSGDVAIDRERWTPGGGAVVGLVIVAVAVTVLAVSAVPAAGLSATPDTADAGSVVQGNESPPGPDNGTDTFQSGADTVSVISTSSVADKNPDVAGTDDGYLLTWGRAAEDGRQVLWSVHDGEGWSDPAVLVDDLAFDTQPSVAYDETNDRGIAVWSEVAEEKSDVAPGDVTDIYYATYEGGTWSAPTRLTDTEYGDFLPRIVENDGSFLVTWASLRNYESGSDSLDMFLGHTTIDGDGQGPVGEFELPAVTWRVSPGGDDPFRIAYFEPETAGSQSGDVVVLSGENEFQEVESYGVSDIGSIALGPDGVAWTTPVEDRVGVRYADDDAGIETVPTWLNSTEMRGLSLVPDGDSTLLTYRPRVEGSIDRRSVYTLRHGGEWIYEHQVAFTTDGDFQFQNPVVATNDDGFATALVGRALQSGASPDVFAVVHDFRPDLAVETGGDPEGVEVGDDLSVPYTVRNVGDRDVGESFEVVLTDGEDVIERRTVGGLERGETVEGQFEATVPGTGRLSVEAAPEGAFPEVSRENNVDALVVSRPDVAVWDVSATRNGSRLTVTATLRNFGGVAADPLEVEYTSGDEVVGTRTVAIGAGERREVDLDVGVSDVVDNRVVVDAAATDDLNPGNATFGVVPLVADLALYERQVEFEERNGSLFADVLVVNHGSGGTNFTLRAIGPDGEEVAATNGAIRESPGEGDLVTGEATLELPARVSGQEVTLIAEAPSDRGEYDNTVLLTVPAVEGITTTPPPIESFEARLVDDGDAIEVEVVAGRQLDADAISVSVSGPVETVLGGSEFESRGSEFSYVARLPVDGGGTYEFELDAAPDSAGNDGANGEVASVTAEDSTPDDSDTPGETDGGGLPGFGVVVALAALVAALALAARRRE